STTATTTRSTTTYTSTTTSTSTSTSGPEARGPRPEALAALLRAALGEMRFGGQSRECLRDADRPRLQRGHLAGAQAGLVAAVGERGQVGRQALVDDRLVRDRVHQIFFAGEVDHRPVRRRDRSGRVDVERLVLGAEAAALVEVLEAEPDRIERLVTERTAR